MDTVPPILPSVFPFRDPSTLYKDPLKVGFLQAPPSPSTTARHPLAAGLKMEKEPKSSFLPSGAHLSLQISRECSRDGCLHCDSLPAAGRAKGAQLKARPWEAWW